MFVALSNEQVLGTTSSWMQEEFSVPNSVLGTNVGSWYLCQFLIPMSVLDQTINFRAVLNRVSAKLISSNCDRQQTPAGASVLCVVYDESWTQVTNYIDADRDQR